MVFFVCLKHSLFPGLCVSKPRVRFVPDNGELDSRSFVICLILYIDEMPCWEQARCIFVW